MKILDALRNAAARVEAHVEDSKLFDQMGDRGKWRERILREFVRPFLPPCYGLASGEVFDGSGLTSRQVDVLVYDSLFCAPLLLDQATNLGVFPCESIYASVEVKSNLTSEELQTAIDNIASVKKLQREPSSAVQILPHVEIPIGAGLKVGPGSTNPYLGMVFAYKGITAETALKLLVSQSCDRELLPNFIFCCDPAYMILRTNDKGTAALFRGDWRAYGAIPTNGDTLPLFFLSLNVCLGTIRLREPNWNRYWIDVVKSLDSKATILKLNTTT